jgi:hypothetical protein
MPWAGGDASENRGRWRVVGDCDQRAGEGLIAAASGIPAAFLTAAGLAAAGSVLLASRPIPRAPVPASPEAG